MSDGAGQQRELCEWGGQGLSGKCRMPVRVWFVIGNVYVHSNQEAGLGSSARQCLGSGDGVDNADGVPVFCAALRCQLHT